MKNKKRFKIVLLKLNKQTTPQNIFNIKGYTKQRQKEHQQNISIISSFIQKRTQKIHNDDHSNDNLYDSNSPKSSLVKNKNHQLFFATQSNSKKHNSLSQILIKQSILKSKNQNKQINQVLKKTKIQEIDKIVQKTKNLTFSKKNKTQLSQDFNQFTVNHRYSQRYSIYREKYIDTKYYKRRSFFFQEQNHLNDKNNNSMLITN